MIARILLAIVILLGSSGLASEVRAVGEADDARLATELKFRQDFGLPADPAAVRALMASPAAYDGNFPVALAASERVEMERRIAMQEQLAPLEQRAQALPGFAGMWIDQPAGGVIKLALVGATDAERVALQALVPRGARFEIVPARHTLADLEALQHRIKVESGELLAQGHRIGLLYPHLESNGIRVGVSGDLNVALAALQARYGDAVSVELADPVTTACTDRFHCKGPPLRAGIAAPTNAAVPCSIAFMITRAGVRQWLTAGHCAPTVGVRWYHDGLEIGTIQATCWPQCQFAEAARAGNIDPPYLSNRVYLSGNSTGRYVTGSQAFNGDNNGDYVCLNARRAEWWRCGSIQSDSTSICYQRDQLNNCTIWYDDQRTANFANAMGDSGGAVHGNYNGLGVLALGVESGCTYMPNNDTCSGNGVYSHIARVLSELGGWYVCSTNTPCE